ncbi:hypothetical protein OOK44_36185 [Streptomyces cellulosae]|uniref:Uncharacterized protein n=1 Tax=Streptomyces althioticus TaxID=83380 RepID=A0ABZ1YJ69_9ACTN|nr:hypothetical protein [Streptomyces cellulosae]WTB93443.1 hypothetical protein OIE99_34935 [Streptomyces cellulosae]WTC60834.1 hypothetical protein OH715_36685 [Streptomyces cellulosae]
MEWMDAVRTLAEDPLVRLVVREGVRGIARRVQRGRGSAGAHSEAGPAATAPGAEGTEMAVTTVADDRTGEQLAEDLLQGVGNEGMRAATRLLGAHRNGFWLRRLLEDEAELSAAADKPVIDRSGTHPSVDWDAIGLLMLSRPGALKCSRSEMVMLEVAASLVRRCAVQIGSVVQAVDNDEFRLILRALQETAYGDGAR